MRQIRWILLIVGAIYVIVLVSGLGVFDHAPGPSNAFAYEYSTTITTSTSTSTSTSRPPACLYTPGYYKNHPGAVTDAVNMAGGTVQLDGRQLTATQTNAVLAATPSKHPGVTFTSNALLTLAQQLLTAELNIARGAVAPASVTQALQQANAGLIVSSGLDISTTLSQSQINSLTNTLTRFNEGRLGGTSCVS
jgi:hypothetical protein